MTHNPTRKVRTRTKAELEATAPAGTTERILASKKEAAFMLSISLRSITTLITQKQLTVRKIGKRTLIPVAEIKRFARGDHNLSASVH